MTGQDRLVAATTDPDKFGDHATPSPGILVALAVDLRHRLTRGGQARAKSFAGHNGVGVLELAECDLLERRPQPLDLGLGIIPRLPANHRHIAKLVRIVFSADWLHMQWHAARHVDGSVDEGDGRLTAAVAQRRIAIGINYTCLVHLIS